jgi:PST family polysaccharide transporter
LDAIDTWFLARERMRPSVLARQSALLAAAALRLVLVWAGAPVWAFALAVMVEALLIAGALAWVLVRDGGRPDWKGVAPVSDGALLREGWPLLVSGVLVVVALQADRLLLLRLAGETVAGVYAAAARFTELLHTLPLALGAVLLPRLTALKQTDADLYWRTARRATGLLILATTLLAAGLTLGGRWLLPLLLGEKYRAAGDVLAVHGWSLVFISAVVLTLAILVIWNAYSP